MALYLRLWDSNLRQTYLAGESFAGQYIPYFGKCAVAASVITSKRDLTSADALLKTPPSPKFVLSGLAIGNGWIDPKEQYPGYLDFAYEKKLLTKGTPVSPITSNLSRDSCQAADQAEKKLSGCMEEIAKYPDAESTPINLGGGCEGVMDTVTAPFTQE